MRTRAETKRRRSVGAVRQNSASRGPLCKWRLFEAVIAYLQVVESREDVLTQARKHIACSNDCGRSEKRQKARTRSKLRVDAPEAVTEASGLIDMSTLNLCICQINDASDLISLMRYWCTAQAMQANEVLCNFARSRMVKDDCGRDLGGGGIMILELPGETNDAR